MDDCAYSVVEYAVMMYLKYESEDQRPIGLMRRFSCGGSSACPEGVAGDFLQVPRDLEAGQVGKEGSSSHYSTKLRCPRSCSSSRLAQVFLTLKDSNISLILGMLSIGRPACIWCEFRIIPRYFLTVSGLMVLFLLGEHWAY